MNIVVLTGAGVSQESGINTFRDQNGLWEGHDVMEVASPHGWNKNPRVVNHFYNQRRAQLQEVEPNQAHLLIAELQNHFKVKVITQNVDNLHERAGSETVIHLHGELTKVRSTFNDNYVVDWKGDLTLQDTCPQGYPLRPHIVWFGEAVPMLEKAAYEVSNADMAIIIGTSMQVYPAASLIGYLSEGNPIFYIDPNPHINYELQRASNFNLIQKKAVEGMIELHQLFIDEFA